MLVAKVRGRYWSDQEATDEAGDVGWAQVRWTPRVDGCLLLHPEDDDAAPFVLVVGSALDLAVVGWIYGHEGKREEFWRTNTGRPAFFVRQSALQAI